MNKVATLIKALDGFRGDARLYKVKPPMQYEVYGEEDFETRSTEFVVVSAVAVPFSGDETYIFPCDSDGKITSWGELKGSFRGERNHVKALLNAGYGVAL